MTSRKTTVISDRKRVGIWVRVSTEDQARGDTPEHHEERARAYAIAKGWEVVTVYHLEGVSGKAVGGHPEARRMLADVENGRITGLIFSKLARLARNTQDLLEFADFFKEHSADLISLQESIDTSTPAGRLFYTMIAGMAQWEREEIVSRINATVPVRAKLGKSLGGNAPFGYEWIDGKLKPHPEQSVLRRRIFELYAEHRRAGAVARILNEAGHRSPTGKPWTDMTVHRLLRDPIVIGKRIVNRVSHRGADGKDRAKPESEWLTQDVEPIVSDQLWAQVQHIVGEPKRRNTQHSRPPVHLFAGYVYCHCGRKMYVVSNSPKYICQKCRTKIPKTDLEDIFYQQLQRFLLSPVELTKFLQEAEASVADKQAELDILNRELETVTREMDQTYRLYLDGHLSGEAFGKRYRPLEEREQQINDALPRLQGEIDALKISYLSSDKILTEAQDLYTSWHNLDFHDRRKIVENLVDRIVIGTDSIEIELCYLPPPSADAFPKLMVKTQQSHRGPDRSRFGGTAWRARGDRNFVLTGCILRRADRIIPVFRQFCQPIVTGCGGGSDISKESGAATCFSRRYDLVCRRRRGCACRGRSFFYSRLLGLLGRGRRRRFLWRG